MRKNIVITGAIIASIGVCFLIGGIILLTTGDIYNQVAQAQGAQNVLIIGLSGLILGAAMIITGRILKQKATNQ